MRIATGIAAFPANSSGRLLVEADSGLDWQAGHECFCIRVQEMRSPSGPRGDHLPNTDGISVLLKPRKRPSCRP